MHAGELLMLLLLDNLLMLLLLDNLLSNMVPEPVARSGGLARPTAAIRGATNPGNVRRNRNFKLLRQMLPVFVVHSVIEQDGVLQQDRPNGLQGSCTVRTGIPCASCHKHSNHALPLFPGARPPT